MARTAIQPEGWPDPRPRYTNAWRVGNTIYVAGQVATDAQDQLVGPDDVREQTRVVMRKIATILEAAGARLSDVVKLTVYLTDVSLRAGYHEARREFYPANPPAGTLVGNVALAVPGALIEIDAVAVVE
ncbi:MAG TPA: RidA family protein [Chloroflexota bacterium]|jgi:enamine deaminase RidA (YjgF/YER057c/UK114 family)